MADQTVQRSDEELPQPAEDPSGDGRKRARPGDDFTTDYHVYEPYQAGLPPLGPYFRELWRRRQFMFQLSHTKLRAQQYDTFFGQLWVVLNPLLMACVYFLLIMVIRGGSRGVEFFAHLTAALFVFQVFSRSVQQGANSIVRGGKLVMNTAFPRVLMPFSAVIGAVRQFFPTIIVYAIIHAAVGVAVGWPILLTVPLLVLIVMMAAGVACFVAAAQVYFRDLGSFLPYVLRIWTYSSPILYTADQAVERGLGVLMWVNPMAPLIRSWSSVIDNQELPDATVVAAGAAWSVALLIAGVVFFMSRERELVVRL